MNVKELIKRLSEFPPETEVDVDYTGFYEAEIVINPRLEKDGCLLKDHHGEPVVYLAIVDANP